LTTGSFLHDNFSSLKLSCGNDSVVKNYIYSNGDLELWPNDPKINRVLPLPQGNHEASIFSRKRLICKERKQTFLYTTSWDGPYYVIGYGRRPHRFPHDNFSSVYWIFTKLGFMIPLYFNFHRHIVEHIINILPQWFHLFIQDCGTYITRNVCITKYARLYKLSNGIMVMK
jgi:hypothetical protein